MKKKYCVLGGLLLSFVLAGASWASYCPLEGCVGGEAVLVDDIVLDPPVTLYKNDTFSWTHDITGDSFDVDTDRVTGATVELFFLNTDYNDQIAVRIEDYYRPWLYSVSAGNVEIDLYWFGIDSLNDNGLLKLKIKAFTGIWDWCDYINLDRPILTDEDRETAPVPEPATMLFLGAGMSGLASLRRKNKK